MCMPVLQNHLQGLPQRITLHSSSLPEIKGRILFTMVQLLWYVRTVIYSFIHVLYVHVEMCYLTKNCIKCISFPFFLIYLQGVYFYEQFVIPLYSDSPWQNIHNVLLMSVTLYWLLYALFDALCTYINSFWIPWKATLTTWQGQNCLPLEPNKSHKK